MLTVVNPAGTVASWNDGNRRVGAVDAALTPGRTYVDHEPERSPKGRATRPRSFDSKARAVASCTASSRLPRPDGGVAGPSTTRSVPPAGLDGSTTHPWPGIVSTTTDCARAG